MDVLFSRQSARLYQNGYSSQDIAKKFGCSKSTVLRHLVSLGVPIRENADYYKGRLNHGTKLIEYVTSSEVAKLGFLDDLWGIRISVKDREDLRRFASIIELVREGKSVPEISNELKLSYHAIQAWRLYRSPNIVHVIRSYLELERPKPSYKWLSLALSSHQDLLGPFVQVPDVVTDFTEVLEVIRQLRPSEQTFSVATRFGFRREDVESMTLRFFFYLLGVLVGDTAKCVHGTGKTRTMSIDLALSKAHASNLRFGAFVALCANSMGLRMSRSKDRKSTKTIPFGAYRWRSQYSLLVNWMMNACLGIREGQTTSHDPIRLDWILSAPRKGRLSFIQGLADSDGFNDVHSLEVQIISSPNAQVVQRILESLGVKTRVDRLKRFRTENVVMSLEDAARLPIYNPYVRSYRLAELTVLTKAKKYPNRRRWPSWLHREISRLIGQGLTTREIFDLILERHNVLVPCGSIRYYVKSPMRATEQ